uniref:Auxin-responsive protein n=1 Tax=Oryza punctata TaxID=4537 RepID=A0A0E0JFZ1_ORYPU
MSPPLELDYIGLSPPPSSSTSAARADDVDLKGTELRLGLPGSESPERRPAATATATATTLELLPAKGAKRVFSDEATLTPPAAAGKGKAAAVREGEEVEEAEEEEDKKVAAPPQPAAKMFTDSCRRLRIMKGSDAIGLAPRAGEKDGDYPS